jgi:hypothetical protein
MRLPGLCRSGARNSHVCPERVHMTIVARPPRSTCQPREHDSPTGAPATRTGQNIRQWSTCRHRRAVRMVQRSAHPGSSPARPTRVRAPPWIFDRARLSTDHSQRRGAVRGGDEPADRQVSHDRQPSRRGAVLGCIPPSRSPCASITFAQLNSGIELPLRPRFRTCTWAPTCSPFDAARQDRGPRVRRAAPATPCPSTRVDLAASTARPPAALA